MSSFWFIIKQQWTIEEISIFSNSSHLEWRAGLSDTILKWDYLRTILAKFGLICFSGFRKEDLNVIFYQNMPNLHNRYKSTERKISQKNTEYMLNYSLPRSCSLNLSSFWLVLKQQWTIEEISIFSNSSHFEWRARLSDTILKWDYPRTIPAKFGLIWFSGFRKEDLNVIFYQNMPNLHNRYKSAERKISQKNTEYMLNYSLPRSCSLNLSSFWLVLKQQWTIEEISIFSNSSHLEWRAGLSDTILKGIHPGTIPARFALIWFSGWRRFKCESLRRRTDGRQVMAKAHMAFGQGPYSQSIR
jgi:hypothetical protein